MGKESAFKRYRRALWRNRALIFFWSVCGGATPLMANAQTQARIPASSRQVTEQEAAKIRLAPTPPMGWNSWNCFKDNIDEARIREIADALVKSGMKDAGYRYIIIDNGWMTDKRDKDGHIIADPVKFPHGMKALADYIHGLGLKFGIYSAPGRYTCGGFLMGSLGHEQIDADDYASWGVDFLKYDWCKYPGTREQARQTSREDCRSAYELMYKCLRRTGRPIVYSVHDKCTAISEKGALPWIKTIASMHRTGRDITNSWDNMIYCLESTAGLWQYAGPGYWNDPDMLEVGNDNSGKGESMNLREYRTQFSMWCMVAAPLIAGNDLRKMTPAITGILTNKEMIAIDQDPLGRQGRRVRDDGDIEVWAKAVSGGRVAVALLNKSSRTAAIGFNWNEIGVKGRMSIRDLWTHRDIGNYQGSFMGKGIPSHGVLVLLLKSAAPAG